MLKMINKGHIINNKERNTIVGTLEKFFMKLFTFLEKWYIIIIMRIRNLIGLRNL